MAPATLAFGLPVTPSATYTRIMHRAMGSPALKGAREAGLRPLRLTYATPAAIVPSRRELPILLNRRRLLGCGVEVGVKTGDFSEMLLDRWRGRHLVSVDPWSEAPAEEYVDLANVAQEEHDRYHAIARDRLLRFGDRSTIWRMTSSEAAPRVLHHSLDFAYIDARHDYDSVREDLELWVDRVRPGGVLAGHDYVDGNLVDGVFGVRSAVDDFFGERGVRVRATFTDPPWFSWWVVLP